MGPVLQRCYAVTGCVMGTFIELVVRCGCMGFVVGLVLVAGGADMVEGIWGLFTRFEGVPDVGAFGWKVTGFSMAALLAALPLGVVGIVWRWVSPGQ